jgi:hypothetical protein
VNDELCYSLDLATDEAVIHLRVAGLSGPQRKATNRICADAPRPFPSAVIIKVCRNRVVRVFTRLANLIRTFKYEMILLPDRVRLAIEIGAVLTT